MLLITFSGMVYSTSAHHRKEEFYERLRKKARTTCRFITQVKEVDTHLLKIIDKNTLTALIDEKVLIFDEDNELVYSSVDDKKITYRHGLLEQIREEKYIEIREGDSEVIGLYYEEADEPLVVLASAYDKFGLSKLHNLRNALLWGLFVGITLTVLLGVYFAGNSLKPISEINQRVSTINASTMKQRLPEGNRRDEIAQLAINFNNMLERLEQAFDQQRNFVTHASHELRTPLAALKSEVQLGQRFAQGGGKEIREIFDNLNSDTDRLISITNSLLFLARSFESLNKVMTNPIRIEEAIFNAREELLIGKSDYSIHIEYKEPSSEEMDTVVQGNEELIKRVFLNLMDNACKYSPDHTATVLIERDSKDCVLSVSDRGIGISEEDLALVFEPFFRAENAKTYSGFGIGLSICRRIVEVHGGTLTAKSKPGEGSVFVVRLPRIA